MNNLHLIILNRGVESWNDWRKYNSAVKPDLSNCTFDKHNLRNFNLEGVNFLGSEFFGVDFSNSDLSFALLDGCVIGFSRFDNTVLYRASLKKAYLLSNTIVNSEFIRSNFSNAKIEKTHIFSSNFTKSNLQNVVLESTRITESTFIHSDFSGSKFDDLLSENCILNCSNFVRANLMNSQFYYSDFVDAKFDNVNLGNCEFYFGNMSSSRFDFASIEPFADESMSTLSYSNILQSLYSDEERNNIEEHLESNHVVIFDNINLDNCSFLKANLSGAFFRESSMIRATLYNANLSSTGLFKCNLSQSNLQHAIIASTHLIKANLSGAILEGTKFVDLDLSKCIGLESCEHYGPSYIDSQTLVYSGELPMKFLRGIGLRDWEIEASRLNIKGLSLSKINDVVYNIFELRSEQPLQFHSCFICFSSSDQEFAEKIYSNLQEEGVRCWFAPEELKGGRKLHQQINEAIHLHEKFIIVLSEDSIKSNWVEHELRKGFKRELKEKQQILFPISLIQYEKLKSWELFDNSLGVDLAEKIREYYIPLFINWADNVDYNRVFKKFIDELKIKIYSK
jgi:uncharacterized protein YjbI with pentapeptide repeats